MSRQARDEHDLVERLVAGERAAFEEVYRRHNAAMLRMCAGFVRNHATAEELVQETWIAVLRNIGGFEGRSSLAGWIYTILLNKARSRLRRDGRSVSFDESGEDNGLQAAFDGRGRWKDMPELWDEITPERVVAGRKVLEHVNAAIEALPSAQRAVLILRGQQGLDTAEVCAILEISEGNVRVLLHRARLAVRAALDRLQ
ncbi:MAG TPA: RNA polymerase subunit sigma-24 [Rhodobacteraceae bacterium]|nr:RNA polymerase subunit sigma-24 [Paracoccaceae bacterium]